MGKMIGSLKTDTETSGRLGSLQEVIGRDGTVGSGRLDRLSQRGTRLRFVHVESSTFFSWKKLYFFKFVALCLKPPKHERLYWAFLNRQF